MTPSPISNRRRLTADEWAQARRRWEGSPQQGFAWLAAEIDGAWGVPISRVAVSSMSRKTGATWEKGPEADLPLPWKARAVVLPAPPATLAAALSDFLVWVGSLDDAGFPRRNRFQVASARVREAQVALLIEGVAAGVFDPVLAATSIRFTAE